MTDVCFHHSDPIREGLERDDPPPCSVLKYCPYGYLVEFFPREDDWKTGKHTNWKGIVFDWLTGEVGPEEFYCPVFSHACPAYFVAEKIPIEKLWTEGVRNDIDRQY